MIQNFVLLWRQICARMPPWANCRVTLSWNWWLFPFIIRGEGVGAKRRQQKRVLSNCASTCFRSEMGMITKQLLSSKLGLVAVDHWKTWDVICVSACSQLRSLCNSFELRHLIACNLQLMRATRLMSTQCETTVGSCSTHCIMRLSVGSPWLTSSLITWRFLQRTPPQHFELGKSLETEMRNSFVILKFPRGGFYYVSTEFNSCTTQQCQKRCHSDTLFFIAVRGTRTASHCETIDAQQRQQWQRKQQWQQQLQPRQTASVSELNPKV